MRRFFLTRVIPIIVTLSVFFGGILLLQNPVAFGFLPLGNSRKTLELEGRSVVVTSAGLSQKHEDFHGTDLEQFDMEGGYTAQMVLAAFQQGYPSKVTDYGYDKYLMDWYIVVGQKRFLWAKGRILPESLLRSGENVQVEQWRPVVDYIYPPEVADPETFTQEIISEIKRTSHPEFRASQPSYHLDFFDALYDGKYQVRIEQNIVSMSFLGRKVNVHRDIVPALSQVEKRILEAAGQSQEVKDFVASISSVDGYNWREIRDRQDRSFHSWGLAVDIMPKGWQKKDIYWNWISDWNPDWMMIPLSKRWMPPKAVVDIFEQHGFVWGGKWMLWDTIHFEYRPELLILQGKS